MTSVIGDEAILTFAFLEAASKGKLDTLKNIFAKNPKLNVNATDYNKNTALHLSSSNGHIEVVKFLLEKSADPSLRNMQGHKPHYLASKNHHKDLVPLLFDQKGTLRAVKARPIKVSDDEIRVLFDMADPHRPSDQADKLTLSGLKKVLKERGLHYNSHQALKKEVDELFAGQSEIPFTDFSGWMKTGTSNLLVRALKNNLSVPNWKDFCDNVTGVFNEMKQSKGGQVATYIPELGQVDPNLFAFAITTVDGQEFHLGDNKALFTMQSCAKPLLYALSIEENGDAEVHKKIGREPSGQSFNAFVLDDDLKPHNALINTGGLVLSSTYKSSKSPAHRFKELQSSFSKLAGNHQIGFSQSTYLSEAGTAFTNNSLAYFMSAKGLLKTEQIPDTLQLYFEMCSMETNVEALSHIAATFASGGTSPASGEKVLGFESVKTTLQIMTNSGMNNTSGVWATTVGLPAKSGVSGAIWMVVPNLMGIAIYSPPLDFNGNSYTGTEFASKLANMFGWGLFDSLFHIQGHPGRTHQEHQDDLKNSKQAGSVAAALLSNDLVKKRSLSVTPSFLRTPEGQAVITNH